MEVCIIMPGYFILKLIFFFISGLAKTVTRFMFSNFDIGIISIKSENPTANLKVT